MKGDYIMDQAKKETIKSLLKLVGAGITALTINSIVWEKVLWPWISGSEEM